MASLEYHREYYQRNITKLREYSNKHRIANRAKLKDYLREWKKNNKEKIKEYAKNYKPRKRELAKTEPYKQKKREHYKKYYKANKERINKLARLRYNRERNHLKVSKRWARTKSSNGSFSLEEWNEIKRLQEYLCLVCKRKEPEIKLTIDHILPISKGGKHIKENIQGLCLSCNSSKGNKIDLPLKLGVGLNSTIEC